MEYYLAVKRNAAWIHADNMDKAWEHYAKWKKPFKKEHILYELIYVKSPEEANL